MASPRTYKTEGVVLKHSPLGEADRILILYTPDMGKVRAVGKGVRRTRSKLSGHLDLLNNVSVSLSQGRSLDVVTEADTINTFRGMRENLHWISKALYVAELVDAFSAEQAANYPLYRLLLDTLGWVERAQQVDLLLRYFEMHLLEHTGYRPELYSCVECRAALEPRDHLFDWAHGGVQCPACRVTSPRALVPASLNAMKVLRLLQRETRYARVEGLRASTALLSEIERLLRGYLRFLMERELRSVEFMNLVSSTGAKAGEA